jgi:hypothetical protein
MIQYSRFMFRKIYGDTRGQIDSIISGTVPPEWDQKLARCLSKYGTRKKMDAVVTRHKKFIDHRLMDFIAFMKKTSVVASESERQAGIDRLESFRLEYPALIDGFVRSVGAYAEAPGEQDY